MDVRQHDAGTRHPKAHRALDKWRELAIGKLVN
jgi:hypothetical protein